VPAGHHRKPPPPWTLRLRRLRTPAVFALVLATAIPVAASAKMTPTHESVTATSASPALELDRTAIRAASRSRDRLTALVPQSSKATVQAVRLRPKWTTTRVNVWRGPGENSKLLTVLDTGSKVRVTGTMRGSWAAIVWKHRTVWVRKAYLARTKPSAAAKGVTAVAAGVSGAPCPDGSAVESGLQPNTVKLYRAVCAAFPAVTSWGGRSGSGGDHGAGRALDIMSTGSLRDAIADYVRAHASAFGVSYVIRAQHIWSVERSSEGWRAMEDRGSATANHFDHVHVSLY
jgi:hypothetical protein